MPTVPRYQRQVGPQLVRRPALDAAAAGVQAAQARAYVGRGLEQIGGSIEQLGGRLGNLAIQQRKEAYDYANQLAILGADNKLATWERTRLHGQNGAFSQFGEASFHLPETIDQEFNETADQIESSLHTPEQKLAFSKIRSDRHNAVTLNITRHVDQQTLNFAKQELAASKANRGDAAIVSGGAGDFNRAGHEMDSYESYLRRVGPRVGWTPMAIDAEVAEFRSAVHVGIINQLVADEHPDMARVYFEVVTGKGGDKRADGTVKGEGFFGPLARPGGGVSSELSIGITVNGTEVEIPTLVPTLTPTEVQTLLALDPETEEIPKAIVDKAVAHARERMAAGKSPFAAKSEESAQYPEFARADKPRSEILGAQLDDVTKLLKVGTTKKDAQRAFDKIEAEGGTFSQQLEKAKDIEDADVRDQTTHYLREADADRQRVKREGAEEMSKGIANILDSGRGIKAIPPAIWKDLDDTDRTRYRNYAEDVARNGQGGAVKTNPNVFGALLSAHSSADPKVRQAWLDTNLAKDFIHLLSASDLQEMQKLQANDRIGKSDPTVFATEGVTNEVINAGLRKVGIDPAGKLSATQKTRLDTFRRKVRDQVDAEFPPSQGKKPSHPDIQRIVDQLSAEVAPARDPWGPFGDAPAQYRFETGAPVPRPGQVTRIDQVPPAEARAIEQAFRANDRPYPTEAQIIQQYNIMHGSAR